MRRRVGLMLSAAVSVLAAGCGGGGHRSTAAAPVASVAPSISTSISTSTVVTVPPTTVAPPPVTTTPPATAVTSHPALVVSPNGVVVPVVGTDPNGWVVKTPCEKTAVTKGTPLAQAAIVLDPGHGGDENGAIGENGLTEKALNLAVAAQAQAALQAAGVPVILTRTADYRMTLDARAAVIAAAKPKAYVSIHHNANPDGPLAQPGTETFYQVHSAQSKRLAGLIWEEVTKALRPYQLQWVGERDAGTKYRLNSRGGDYYAILRGSEQTTGALAELAFLADPPEATLLARPDVQKAEGQAVARAIVRWLTTKDPGSGFVTPYPRTEPAGPGGGLSGCLDPAL